jgi:hypothetical protein
MSSNILRINIQTLTAPSTFMSAPLAANHRLVAAGVSIRDDHENLPARVFCMWGIMGAEDYIRMAAIAAVLGEYDRSGLRVIVHTRGLKGNADLRTIVAKNGVMNKKGDLYKGSEFVPTLRAAVSELRLQVAAPDWDGKPDHDAARAKEAAKLGLVVAQRADTPVPLELAPPLILGQQRMPELEGTAWWQHIETAWSPNR